MNQQKPHQNSETQDSRFFNPFSEQSSQNYGRQTYDSILNTNYQVIKRQKNQKTEIIKCRRNDGTDCIVKKIQGHQFNQKEIKNWILLNNIMSSDINIVQYFNSWKENQEIFISMEKMSCNLEEFIQYKQITPKIIDMFLYQITRALVHMHQNEIVHLDIKPDNILINKKGFNIADFGHSINLKEKKQVMVLVEGDVRYCARELLDYTLSKEQDSEQIKKADIFSLGLTLYRLITNCELPKNGQDWKLIREGKIECQDESKKFHFELVKSMITENPANRPTAEEIFTIISEQLASSDRAMSNQFQSQVYKQIWNHKQFKSFWRLNFKFSGRLFYSIKLMYSFEF